MSELTAQARRQEGRAAARRSILSATAEILDEDGHDGLSVRKLVDRCGYSAPTIYHHFGDKPGLLDTLLEERFFKLAKRLERLDGDAPEADVRAQAFEVVRFAQRYPSHYQLLLLPREPDWKPPESVERARDMLRRPLHVLWDEGRLRAGDLDSAIQGLWALLHGIISLRTTRPEGEWSRTWIEDAIDALLHGLVAPAPAAAPRRKGSK
jgi:AcrR family transcriptional regulator